MLLTHPVETLKIYLLFLQFVTRAVRIIDLMTNMCTQSFENHNGLKVFIDRLDVSILSHMKSTLIGHKMYVFHALDEESSHRCLT